MRGGGARKKCSVKRVKRKGVKMTSGSVAVPKGEAMAVFRHERATVPSWFRLGQEQLYGRLASGNGGASVALSYAMDSAVLDGQRPAIIMTRELRGFAHGGEGRLSGLVAERVAANLADQAEMRRVIASVAGEFPNMLLDGDGDATLYGEEGVLIIGSSRGGMGVNARFFSQEFHDRVLAKIWTETVPYVREVPAPAGEQYLLVLTDQGYQPKETRSLALPMVREHYAPDVVEKFDVVVRELAAAEPPGRLVLIEGVPGTGKTFLCRAIFDGCKEAAFLMVQSSIIEDLTGPTLLRSLLDFYENTVSRGQRIVLVLEDGDECVREREDGKEGPVAALLALSDGLLGHVLDLRIVVTTNKKIAKMDPAVLRPGRLLSRIEVGALPPGQVERLVAKKSGCDEAEVRRWFGRHDEGATLAQVFERARALAAPPETRRIEDFKRMVGR